MPKLKELECSIELAPSRERLQEVGTVYADGVVEAFVPVPSDSRPFTIHVLSTSCIAPGLAIFVYIDGKYMCNRVLEPQKTRSGKPSIFEARLRQKEDPRAGDKFIGSEWNFAKFDVVPSDEAPKLDPQILQNLGSIEVVILRVAKFTKVNDPSDRKSPLDITTRSKPRVTFQLPPKTAVAKPMSSNSGFDTVEAGGMFGLFDGAGDYSDHPFDLDGGYEARENNYGYPGTYRDYGQPVSAEYQAAWNHVCDSDEEGERDSRKEGSEVRTIYTLPEPPPPPKQKFSVRRIRRDSSASEIGRRVKGLNVAVDDRMSYIDDRDHPAYLPQREEPPNQSYYRTDGWTSHHSTNDAAGTPRGRFHNDFVQYDADRPQTPLSTNAESEAFNRRPLYAGEPPRNVQDPEGAAGQRSAPNEEDNAYLNLTWDQIIAAQHRREAVLEPFPTIVEPPPQYPRGIFHAPPEATVADPWHGVETANAEQSHEFALGQDGNDSWGEGSEKRFMGAPQNPRDDLSDTDSWISDKEKYAGRNEMKPAASEWGTGKAGNFWAKTGADRFGGRQEQADAGGVSGGLHSLWESTNDNFWGEKDTTKSAKAQWSSNPTPKSAFTAEALAYAARMWGLSENKPGTETKPKDDGWGSSNQKIDNFGWSSNDKTADSTGWGWVTGVSKKSNDDLTTIGNRGWGIGPITQEAQSGPMNSGWIAEDAGKVSNDAANIGQESTWGNVEQGQESSETKTGNEDGQHGWETTTDKPKSADGDAWETAGTDAPANDNSNGWGTNGNATEQSSWANDNNAGEPNNDTWGNNDNQNTDQGDGWGNGDTEKENNEDPNEQVDTKQDEQADNGGWGNHESNSQADAWGAHQALESNSWKDKAVSSPKDSDSKPRSIMKKPLYQLPAGAKSYYMDWTRAASGKLPSVPESRAAPVEEPFVEEAVPLYKVPSSYVEAQQLEHQVQVGPGARWFHLKARPTYMDNLLQPYAIFRFKYRSRATLKEIFGDDIIEPEVSASTESEEVLKEKLLHLSKEDLIEQFLKLRATVAGDDNASNHSGKSDRTVRPASNASWGHVSNKAGSQKAASDHGAANGNNVSGAWGNDNNNNGGGGDAWNAGSTPGDGWNGEATTSNTKW